MLAVGEMPGMKHRRAVVQIKSSLAPNGQTILFDLDPAHGFLWAGTSELTADDIMNPVIERESPAREEAEEFLTDILKDGKMKSKDVESEAKDFGITIKTLRNAREKLKIVCTRGKGDDKSWYWELAHIQNTGASRANRGNMGDFQSNLPLFDHVAHVNTDRQVEELPTDMPYPYF